MTGLPYHDAIKVMAPLWFDTCARRAADHVIRGDVCPRCAVTMLNLIGLALGEGPVPVAYTMAEFELLIREAVADQLAESS